MNTQDTEPKIIIDGHAVTAATARDLASRRIRAIEQRLAEIKLERTALNRETHDLARWVYSAEEKRKRDRKTRATLEDGQCDDRLQ